MEQSYSDVKWGPGVYTDIQAVRSDSGARNVILAPGSFDSRGFASGVILSPQDFIQATLVSCIDYRCDNRRFRLSAHDCPVPTPTSQNLEVEQQIRFFWSRPTRQLLGRLKSQFLICRSIHQKRQNLRSWGWGLTIHAG